MKSFNPCIHISKIIQKNYRISIPVIDKLRTVGSVNVIDIVSVHPVASFTVTLYVPAVRLFRSCVVSAVFHKYVYGITPPITDRSMLPVLSPLHRMFTAVMDKAIGFAGSVSVISILS